MAGPVRESLCLATVSGPIASFASSDAACIETDSPPRFGEGDLEDGREVGDGDGDDD